MSRPPSLKDAAYGRVREAIVTGELADGSQHSIYRLASELGVSRTPVREAVLRLADEGLLSIERNRGVRVRGITAAKVRDIVELRLLLEVPATRWAAVHGDDDFRRSLDATTEALLQAADEQDDEAFHTHDRALHDHIARAFGNARLASALDELRDVTRTHGAWTGHRARPVSEIAAEHASIAQALVAGDASAAGEAMRQHLVRTGALLMADVAARTGEVVDLTDWPRL